MGTYGYRCAWCGPFEKRANARAPGAPAPCPTCDALSPRTYSAPAARSPRRASQLDGVGPAGRARIERAQAGTPRAGALPPGRRTHGAPASRGGKGPGRPWQIGH
jgi:putative FmdB family regulatory protein